MSGAYNTIKNSSSTVSVASGFLMSGHNNTVTNCIVRDCNWMPTYDAGIRYAKRDDGMAGEGNAIVISHNTIYNCGRQLIEIHRDGESDIPGNEIKILYNDLGRCGWLSNEVTSIGNNWIKNIEIAYNHFHSLAGGSKGYLGSDKRFCGDGFKIHHNVFFTGDPIVREKHGTGPGGIGAHWYLAAVHPEHKIYNNTIVKPCSDGGRGRDMRPPHEYPYNSPLSADASRPWRWNNNIYTSYTRYREIDNDNDGIIDKWEIDYDSWIDWKYADTANNDYSLTEGSPAIDAGVVLPGMVEDFEGKAPDLGAYEYGRPVWKPGADWKEKDWVYPVQNATPGMATGPLRHTAFAQPGIFVTRNLLRLDVPAGIAYDIRLLDSRGRVMLTRKMPRGGTCRVGLAGLPAGIHVLRVKLPSGGAITRQIVVAN